MITQPPASTKTKQNNKTGVKDGMFVFFQKSGQNSNSQGDGIRRRGLWEVTRSQGRDPPR